MTRPPAGNGDRLDGGPGDERCLYLLMYAPGNVAGCNESMPGEDWLQAEMFLLKDTVPGIGPESGRGGPGPYCRDLAGMLARGMDAGDIVQPGGRHGPFWLSARGQEAGRRLWDGADGRTRTEISDLKTFINDMTYDEMIAHACSTFPQMAANPDIADRFDRIRIDAACSLFRREKVTLKRAAMVAGLPSGGFAGVLEGRGIPAYVASVDSLAFPLKRLEGAT